MIRLMVAASKIKRSFFLVLMLFQTSCALHYTDQAGNNHHIGFVSIRTEKSNCVLTNTVKSIGLSIDATSDSGGINLGMRSLSKSYIQHGDYIELEEDEAGTLVTTKYSKSLQRTQKGCAAE